MRSRPTVGLVLAAMTVLPATAFASWAGTRDPAFGTRGVAAPDLSLRGYVAGTDVLVQQPGDRILAAGSAQLLDRTTRVVVTRLLADGRLDTSYGHGGK